MTENSYPSYSTIEYLSRRWADIDISNLKSKFRFMTYDGKFQCKVNDRSELNCNVKDNVFRSIKWKINNKGLTLIESKLHNDEIRSITASLEDDLGSILNIKMNEYNKRLNKIHINNYPSDEVDFTFSNKKYQKFKCTTNFMYKNTLWCHIRNGISDIMFNVNGKLGLNIKENKLKSENLDDIIDALEKEFGAK
jgi:hypothetical protein